MLQRPAEPGAELVERGVIDMPPFHQPKEIEAVVAGFFEFPATPDAAIQPTEYGRGDVFGVDGRLPLLPQILVFPIAPIDGFQNLIHQPHWIVRSNDRIQGGKPAARGRLATIDGSVSPILLRRHGPRLATTANTVYNSQLYASANKEKIDGFPCWGRGEPERSLGGGCIRPCGLVRVNLQR